jgi:hypothetical protein
MQLVGECKSLRNNQHMSTPLRLRRASFAIAVDCLESVSIWTIKLFVHLVHRLPWIWMPWQLFNFHIDLSPLIETTQSAS